ncbi:MAG: hypothetical protein HY289_03950, partial [Planctomycetes bacterium]|nr:hypothetical protein [Planctomycetota bacterium]
PGHFIVRHEPKDGKPQLIDVFAGKLMSRAEAEKKVLQITERDATDKDFEAATKKEIVVRMLQNLINVAKSERDGDGMLRYLDGVVAIDPKSHEDRWARANFRSFAGQRLGAIEDCDHLLKNAPAEVHERVRDLRRRLASEK